MMWPRTLTSWIFSVVLLMLALGIGIGLGTIAVNIGSPVEILEQEDLGRIALHDDRLWIRYKVSRTRECLADSNHFLTTKLMVDGQETMVVIPLVLRDGPVPFAGLGLSDYILSVPRPSGLFPGTWQLVSKTEDRCGPWGWIWPHRTQTTPLTIDIEQIRAAPGVPVVGRHKDGSITERSRSPLLPLVKP